MSERRFNSPNTKISATEAVRNKVKHLRNKKIVWKKLKQLSKKEAVWNTINNPETRSCLEHDKTAQNQEAVWKKIQQLTRRSLRKPFEPC
ncbi:hypothetical protein Bpfe_001985 [Biomphalaria pfeifferi]|uniref:Uncharacterized protein n=1 Tax=Biomphalaria pfeifferi TaxID=112525 RepID=A0AAD8C823_BIOPF|nr:hypothetical protein Bpfe_001985 [Biomphalaria pfeifferi]